MSIKEAKIALDINKNKMLLLKEFNDFTTSEK